MNQANVRFKARVIAFVRSIYRDICIVSMSVLGKEGGGQGRQRQRYAAKWQHSTNAIFFCFQADLSCRNTKQTVGAIYTRTNFVTLRYVTDAWGTKENGFRLVITAVKDPSECLCTSMPFIAAYSRANRCCEDSISRFTKSRVLINRL